MVVKSVKNEFAMQHIQKTQSNNNLHNVTTAVIPALYIWFTVNIETTNAALKLGLKSLVLIHEIKFC